MKDTHRPLSFINLQPHLLSGGWRRPKEHPEVIRSGCLKEHERPRSSHGKDLCLEL